MTAQVFHPASLQPLPGTGTGHLSYFMHPGSAAMLDSRHPAASKSGAQGGASSTSPGANKRPSLDDDLSDPKVDAQGKKLRNALHDITNASGTDSETKVLGINATAVPTGSRIRMEDVMDIDATSRDDPLACTSCVQEVYLNLRAAECRRRPSTCYMESVQRDLTPEMRAILVDWLVDVGLEYRIVPETLHLAVSYLDRYLSVTPVLRSKLQLVGITAMVLASKYEEIYPPSLDEFCYITDNTFTKEEILQCERDMLRVLNFELTVPTARVFLKRYLRAAQADSKTEYLASYFVELSMLDYRMLNYLPSCIAASAVFLALLTLGKPVMSPTMQYYMGYSAKELQHSVRSLHRLFALTRQAEASSIRDKYAAHAYKCVSTIAPSHPTLPDHFFQ